MTIGELVNIILIGVLVCITAYYAWQTRRQANTLKDQIEMVIDQRKKSIAPVLQLSGIQYNDAIIWLYSRSKILTPNLSINITNVGGGPAVDLNVLAEAIVMVQSIKEPDVKKYIKMTWETYTESEMIHLAARSNEKIKLGLIRSEILESMDPVCEMSFKLKFQDMDYKHCEKLQTIKMHEKLSKMIIGSYDSCLVPGDEGYPGTFEPRLI
ncbi:hypothetical protein ACFLVI_03655 [Chloroflexota bacterium]